MFENPEYVFNDLIGRGPYEEIFATVYALIGGATQPTAEPIESPEFSAAFKSKHHVVFQETVIVHGTGAKSKTWWREQPGQRNFWAYIHKYCTGLFGAGKEFSWSGGNTNSDREQGARDFINWWQTVGAPRPLQVIAHSHGCNVVYLACVMEPKLHISNMVSLGGPVRTWYPPPIDMQARISRIHNIYSRFDTVQLLGSIGGRRGEGRTLADSAQITNYHVAWEDPGVQVKSVGHSDLHEPVVWHNNKIAEKTLL